MRRIIKHPPRQAQEATKALCFKRDGYENSYVLDADNLPEVITGYDPTYILQFGFPQEPSYQDATQQLETLEDLKR